jgi:hypothetical protein
MLEFRRHDRIVSQSYPRDKWISISQRSTGPAGTKVRRKGDKSRGIRRDPGPGVSGRVCSAHRLWGYSPQRLREHGEEDAKQRNGLNRGGRGGRGEIVFDTDLHGLTRIQYGVGP